MRYRHLGMEPVSLATDLRRVVIQVARLLISAPRSRRRAARSLANRLGIMIGRIHGALVVSLGFGAWLVSSPAEPPPAPAITG